MRWIYRGEYTSIYFIILYNTPVGVVRKRKILTFVSHSVYCRIGITYCESVFRKSFIENVEVFMTRRAYGTTLTFV